MHDEPPQRDADGRGQTGGEQVRRQFGLHRQNLVALTSAQLNAVFVGNGSSGRGGSGVSTVVGGCVVFQLLQGYQSQLKNSIKLLRTNYGLFIKNKSLLFTVYADILLYGRYGFFKLIFHISNLLYMKCLFCKKICFFLQEGLTPFCVFGCNFLMN